MIIEKPLTDNMKERCKLLKDFFISQDVSVTKKEICEKCFNWEYNISNDRKVRDIIANVAHYYPIISVSDKRGYKIAKTLNDIEQIKHSWAELDSRINELSKRKKPLIDFLQKHNINLTTS
jgi:hypothetical protein